MKSACIAFFCGSLLALFSLQVAAQNPDSARLVFSIPPLPLADALDVFSEQSDLQIVYQPADMIEHEVRGVQGYSSAGSVLQELLKDTGLDWSLVGNHTVVIGKQGTGSSLAAAPAPVEEESSAGLTDILVERGRWNFFQQEPSSASFGFNKSILETPRSVSVMSQDFSDHAGLASAEDLVRFTPGVFTPARFGIQGSVDVRNTSADSYFRGMKRLNLKGHARSILGAADTIEIVRGPPSPLYGMGKVGGYTNIIPKSSRARIGSYQNKTQGFGQITTGSYDQSEISFGIGGPLNLQDRRGGFYVYSLLEDSGTYTRDVDVNHKLLQVTFTLDELPASWRIESGFSYQRSNTSGALLNRVTQELVDEGLYIGGSPLVNLDLNNNGKIGFFEMHQASPVTGELSEVNQPLIQRWNWPVDEAGNYYPLGQFPQQSGIPESLYDYLGAHPDADPGGLLRAQGIGGPQPPSAFVPLGFALDPRTISRQYMDPRVAAAYEREVQAELALLYFDLIRDIDPDFTIRNQFFVDNMDQYKISEQPGGGKQDVLVMEDRITVTRRLPDLPSWLSINTLYSFNLRKTHASGYRYGGDQGSHRSDALHDFGRLTPNTSFVHPFDNDELLDDGAFWFSDYFTSYWEAGSGFLLDLSIREKTNLLLGARADYSRAKNVEYAGTLNPNAGTSAMPGVLRGQDDKASGHDSGSSWSISLSHRFAPGVLPYFTLAQSSLTLEDNNNRIRNSIINDGHIGTAILKEAGIKFSLPDDSLQMSLLYFEQSRVGIDEQDEDISPEQVTPTATRGWEAELKWSWRDALFLSLYAVHQLTRFEPEYGDYILVDARTLGFQDVKDEAGNVVYPAEAFLYGGRSFLNVPDGMDGLEYRQGNPEMQYGLYLGYQLQNGWGAAVNGNYFSSVYSGRLKQVKLPATSIYNFSLYCNRGNWQYRVDLLNAADQRYYQSRSGDNLGETLLTAMPGRQTRMSLRYNF